METEYIHAVMFAGITLIVAYYVGPILSVTIAAALVMPLVLAHERGKGVEGRESALPSPPTSTSTPSTGQSQSGDSWDVPEWALPMLAVVVGVVLVATCVFFVGRSIRRGRRDAKEAAALEKARREALQAAWARLLTREKVVMDRFLSYDRDLSKLLAAPLMRDYREPLVIAAVEAMNRVRELSTPVVPEQVTDVENSDYARAVRAFENAVRLAEIKARRDVLRSFSPAERRSVERARRMLAIVLDQGATQFERHSAYRRVIAELDGFLEVPQSADVHLGMRLTRCPQDAVSSDPQDAVRGGPQDAILAVRS